MIKKLILGWLLISFGIFVASPMWGQQIYPYRGYQSRGVFDPQPGGGGCSEATTFIARTSGLDGTHTTAYTDLICGLVTDGVFTKLDNLYIFATQDSTTSLLNLISTSFNATVNGTPTFTADRGYVGSLTNNIQSYNASTAGGLYTQNSAHIMVWSNPVADGDSFEQVSSGSTATTGINQHIFSKFVDGKAYFRINKSGAAGVAVTNGHGFYLGNRSASNAWQGYKDTSQIITGADVSTTLGNAAFIFPGNNGASGSVNQISAGGFGGSLSSTDAGNYNSRMRTFMTTVGVP